MRVIGTDTMADTVKRSLEEMQRDSNSFPIRVDCHGIKYIFAEISNEDGRIIKLFHRSSAVDFKEHRPKKSGRHDWMEVDGINEKRRMNGMIEQSYAKHVELQKQERIAIYGPEVVEAEDKKNEISSLLKQRADITAKLQAMQVESAPDPLAVAQEEEPQGTKAKKPKESSEPSGKAAADAAAVEAAGGPKPDGPV